MPKTHLPQVAYVEISAHKKFHLSAIILDFSRSIFQLKLFPWLQTLLLRNCCEKVEKV